MGGGGWSRGRGAERDEWAGFSNSPPVAVIIIVEQAWFLKIGAAEEAGRTKKVNRFAAIEMDCAAAVFGAFPRRGRRAGWREGGQEGGRADGQM